MILTRDNLLRFIREKKHVTPTIIAQAFETTTMIASAALSELSKDKLIAISDLKLGSTPYYYDPKQKSCLIELGEKQLSGYDKEIFLKLKEHEIIPDSALTIQEHLAIERIKDFAKNIKINFENKDFSFWIWYLRDINETKNQILNVLKQKNETPKKDEIKKNTPAPKTLIPKELPQKKPIQKTNIEEEKIEEFIEKYLKENHLKIESKQKNEKNINYCVTLKINTIEITIDCIYYSKKPSESELMQFYTSSIKPKIVFIQNPPKKLFTLSESLQNLKLVNI